MNDVESFRRRYLPLYLQPSPTISYPALRAAFYRDSRRSFALSLAVGSALRKTREYVLHIAFVSETENRGG